MFAARINVQSHGLKRIPQEAQSNAWLKSFRIIESMKKSLKQWLISTKYLVALAVSLDRDGIKFGLGDNGDLSVEVDAENIC